MLLVYSKLSKGDPEVGVRNLQANITKQDKATSKFHISSFKQKKGRIQLRASSNKSYKTKTKIGQNSSQMANQNSQLTCFCYIQIQCADNLLFQLPSVQGITYC